MKNTEPNPIFHFRKRRVQIYFLLLLSLFVYRQVVTYRTQTFKDFGYFYFFAGNVFNSPSETTTRDLSAAAIPIKKTYRIANAPANYPLLTYAFFRPFHLVRPSVAQKIFFWFNHLCGLLILWLLIRAFKLNPIVVCLLYLISTPVYKTIGSGQTNLFALATVLGGFYCYERNKILPALLLLSLGILSKFFLIFLIFYFLIQRRDIRFSALLTGAVGLLFFLPALIVPLPVFTHWLFKVFLPNSQNYAGSPLSYALPSMFINLLHVPKTIAVIGGQTITLLLALGYTRIRLDSTEDNRYLFMFYLGLSVLFSPYTTDLHYLFVFPALIVLVATIRRDQPLTVGLLVAGIGLLVLCLNPQGVAHPGVIRELLLFTKLFALLALLLFPLYHNCKKNKKTLTNDAKGG